MGGKRSNGSYLWKKVPYPMRSLNAVMARALDLDEVHDIGTVHPSAAPPGNVGAVEFVKRDFRKEFITQLP
jgi:hypothetical protein